jgi:sulfoxide reductase heme-binding subunit YedZ
MDRWRWIKAAVFVACLVPLARLVVLGFTEALSANPIEFVTRSTGTWTLVFLCITLAVTPLRRLTGWNGLIKLRRMLGLYAFFYACLHFTTFIWFDHFFDVGEMLKDVLKRPFITVGFVAFLLLIPLAVTSTNGWVRRLGGKRWQALHRSVYLIAVLAVLHYWWHKAGKNDLFEPAIYAAVIGVLLLARIVWRIRQARAARSVARPGSSDSRANSSSTDSRLRTR